MKIFALLFLLAYSAFGACSKISMPTDFSSVASGTRANLKANFSETENKFNPCADSVDEVRSRLSGYSGSFMVSSLENLKLRLDSDASATSKFIVEGSGGDTLFRVSEDSTARFFGALTGTGLTLSGNVAAANGIYSGTLGVTGLSTLTGGLQLSGLSGAGAAGQIYATPVNGTVIRSAVGSTNDFLLSNNAGSTVFTVPTGTSTAAFAGATNHSGNQILTASTWNLMGNTSDGADNIRLTITPGGGSNGNTDRAPYLSLRANEESGVPGTARLSAGNISGGTLVLATGNDVARLTIDQDGDATFSDPVTFTAAPVFNSATASQFLLLDGSKALTSVAGTGTGGVMRQASPTTTGTLTAEAISASGDLQVQYSIAGSSVDILAKNTASSGVSSAVIKTDVATGSTGDPYIQFNINGGAIWSAGPDNDDGDAFVITPGSRPGLPSTNGLRISTAGAVSIPATLSIGGNEDFTYDEGSFTCTATGGTTSPTGTCNYVRMGKSVTLVLGNTLNMTSNANTFTYTGLPAGIQPATLDQEIPLSHALDNTATVYNVSAFISAGSGTIIFKLNNSASGWTSSGSKGLAGNGSGKTITYSLQ